MGFRCCQRELATVGVDLEVWIPCNPSLALDVPSVFGQGVGSLEKRRVNQIAGTRNPCMASSTPANLDVLFSIDPPPECLGKLSTIVVAANS
jgi:hypothetical protein